MGLGKIVNAGLSHFGLKVVRLQEEPNVRPGNAYSLDAVEPKDIDLEIRKLLNLTAYTKSSGTAYNAQDFQSAYHTLRIGGHEFKGQRDPAQRLQDVPFDFDGATVVDLGCNQGGMLLSIADRIRSGVGLDYDSRMINAANRIGAYMRKNNLDYYVFDLERENLEVLRNFFDGKMVDIVFLLSVCMWLKNWKSVIDAAKSFSPALLFESNGSDEQQHDQEEYLRGAYDNVLLLRHTSPDDPGQQRRRLFLCNNGLTERVSTSAGSAS